MEIAESEAGLSITLSQENAGNLLTLDDVREVHRHLDYAESARKRWVLIRHTGPDFCLGRVPEPEAIDPAQTLIALVERLRLMEHVVTISAVRGGCVGFGVGLFALTDISIAGSSAWFQFPEMLHGVAPAIVATWLFDLVPYKQGLYWIATGEQVTAAQAHQFGLISRLVEDAELEAVAAMEIERVEGLSAAKLRDVKAVARTMASASQDIAARRGIALRWFPHD